MRPTRKTAWLKRPQVSPWSTSWNLPPTRSQKQKRLCCKENVLVLVKLKKKSLQTQWLPLGCQVAFVSLEQLQRAAKLLAKDCSSVTENQGVKTAPEHQLFPVHTNQLFPTPIAHAPTPRGRVPCVQLGLSIQKPATTSHSAHTPRKISSLPCEALYYLIIFIINFVICLFFLFSNLSPKLLVNPYAYGFKCEIHLTDINISYIK